jgi:glycosyltransferase involved in cell wall biosynthesis
VTRLPVLLDGRAAMLGRPGGWERYTAELVSGLGDSVDVTPAAPPTSRLADIAWEWTSLPLRARQHELVHFPAFPPTPAVRGRVVYTLHDLVWWRYPELTSRGGRLYYRRLAALAAGRAAHLVTVSQAVADEIAGDLGLSAGRVDVIPPGVRPWDPTTEPEQRERPYLLTVGAVEPRKNLDRLLAAYARSGLAGRVDLLLVGRAAWGSLPEGAEHLGAVDDRRLEQLYAGATAVVALSLYEGFGLPVAEALSAGTPVLCSDIASFREVAGGAARLVDPLDVDAVAAALHDAAGGELPEPPADFGRRFTWQRCVEEHRRLYERLLG